MKSQATTTKSYSINGLMVICALLLSTISIAQTTVTLEDQCNCEVLQGTDVSAPGAITPIGADLGDLYVNTTSGTIYFWDGDSWELTTAANTDNQQLQNFTFDAATNVLTLDLENGGSVNVNLTDLQDTLVDTNTTNNRIEVAGPNLVITDSENNTISIPLADIAAQVNTNTTITSFEIDGSNTNLVMTDSDSNSFSIAIVDIAALVNTDNQNLENFQVNGANLELGISNGNTVSIPLNSINTDNQTLLEVLTEGADAGGTVITNVGTPVSGTDAVTKDYVDGLADDDISGASLDAPSNVLTISEGTTDVTVNLSDLDDSAGVAANAADIATNTTNIATNAGDIVNNSNDITTNATNIATNTTDIATNASDIVNNANDITTNATNIAANTTDIANHIANDNDTDDQNEIQNLTNVLGEGADAGGTVITNVGTPVSGTDAVTKDYVDGLADDDISGASLDAPSNVLTISEGTTDVTVNLSDLDDSAGVAANAADIATNTTNIATNAGDIVNNSNDITTNATNIATNTTDIATNASDIVNNANDITTNATNIAANTTDIANHIANDNDTDDQNEIQDLDLTGDNLTLSNDPTATAIDLSDYRETVAGTNDITVTDDGNGNYTVDYIDADSDPTNELTLRGNGGPTGTPAEGTTYVDTSNGQLYVYDSGAWAPVGGSATPGDASNTNELITSFGIDGTNLRITEAGTDFDVPLSSLGTDEQDLTLTGDNLALSNDPTATAIDLSQYDQTVSAGTGISVNQVGDDFAVTNTAPDQTVSLADGGNGNVTVGGSYPNFTIDVPDATVDTDDQDLGIGAGGVANQSVEVTITDGSSVLVDVRDGDFDDTNEDQTVSAGAGISVNQVGDDFAVTNTAPDQTVSLADGGNGNVTVGGSYPNFTIDVPDATVDTDDQDLTNVVLTANESIRLDITDGNSTTIDIRDADSSITNEIQDLTLTGDNLALSNDPTATAIDLSQYDQTVSAGAGISVNQVGDDFAVTNTAPDQTVSLADGGNGNVTVGGTYPNFTIDVPDATVDTDDQDLGIGAGGVANQSVEVTITDGSSALVDVRDGDFDDTNEDQTVSAGAGISVNQVGDDFAVTNTAPDQTVSLADGGNGNVTVGGTYPNFTIDVPDATVDTDDQDLTNVVLTANESIRLDITDGNSTTIDIRDADSNPNNEIQVLGRTGTNITLTNGGGSVSIADNDNDSGNEIQTLTSGDGSVTLTPSINDYDLSVNFPANNDNSATNELSDLDLTSDILTLTNPANPGNQVDLSPYLDNTDNQNASQVNITDTDGNFTSGNVEGALDELADSIAANTTTVTAGNDIGVTGDGSSATPYVIANTRPNIFYPPSISIDVSAYSGTPILNETIDLHAQYIAQYGSPMVRSDVGGGDEAPTAIPTYASGDLYYYVTFFDNTVFANVEIDADGEMEYDIIGAPADYNSLINVVFVVK